MSALKLDIGLVLCLASAAYAVLTLVAFRFARGRRARAPKVWLGVSILKPLHGAEPRLYENLASFCRQDYPQSQLLLGVRDAQDPAVQIAHRLQRQFPQHDIEVVIDPRLHGRNYKVSNLTNLLAHARHPWLVIADSDISVGQDYLRHVCAPLARPEVGTVTCLYRARPLGGLWSQLGRLFIDEWFVPSVHLTKLFGAREFGFGATLALRRITLDDIGGFTAITDELADDYRLAQRVRACGLQTELSDYVVTTDVSEPSARGLLARELRWLRTIRMLNPVGYAFMPISFDIAVACVGTLLADADPTALVLLATACLARAALHFAVMERSEGWVRRALLTLPLVPLRDTLNVALWGIGFARRRVAWAGQDLQFDHKGLFRDSAS
ncbi:MAG TPA: bacteriohopanetetrol glucosamine biosynthesis glycosyltransferase HpnI [Nevskiaceae bacterium]|nr:bacteriohopanetetrol glucosamine biosynthesis glycosyltransferase HpnI [Nevskiaceae bacterium]